MKRVLSFSIIILVCFSIMVKAEDKGNCIDFSKAFKERDRESRLEETGEPGKVLSINFKNDELNNKKDLTISSLGIEKGSLVYSVDLNNFSFKRGYVLRVNEQSNEIHVVDASSEEISKVDKYFLNQDIIMPIPTHLSINVDVLDLVMRRQIKRYKKDLEFLNRLGLKISYDIEEEYLSFFLSVPEKRVIVRDLPSYKEGIKEARDEIKAHFLASELEKRRLHKEISNKYKDYYYSAYFKTYLETRLTQNRFDEDGSFAIVQAFINERLEVIEENNDNYHEWVNNNNNKATAEFKKIALLHIGGGATFLGILYGLLQFL